MPTDIDSKLPEVGTTIFTVMSGLAEAHDAINLSQGFPDFEPAEALLDRVTHYLKSGKNQYPPMTGVLELRRSIADKLRLVGGVEVDPETEITVTSGATEALFCAIHAVVRPGDEVIVFDPAYDSYGPAVALAGGKTVHLALTLPHYRIDWAALEAALNPKTRLIIINSPHNPSGTILTVDDLDRLSKSIGDHDCYVLSDEVYEHIIFDGETHASVLAHPQLAPRSFAVFSFGKTYHATGWKIGYCISPQKLTTEFRKVHQFNTFTTVAPMQWALADFIREQPGYYARLSSFYQQKRVVDGGLPFQVAAVPGHLFSTGGLWRLVARHRPLECHIGRYGRHGIRTLAHHQKGRRRHPAVAVLPRPAESTHHPFLLRQAGPDAETGGGNLVRDLNAGERIWSGPATASHGQPRQGHDKTVGACRLPRQFGILPLKLSLPR